MRIAGGRAIPSASPPHVSLGTSPAGGGSWGEAEELGGGFAGGFAPAGFGGGVGGAVFDRVLGEHDLEGLEGEGLGLGGEDAGAELEDAGEGFELALDVGEIGPGGDLGDGEVELLRDVGKR